MGAQEKKHKEQQKSLTTLSTKYKNSHYFYLTVLVLYSVVQHRGHNTYVILLFISHIISMNIFLCHLEYFKTASLYEANIIVIFHIQNVNK